VNDDDVRYLGGVDAPVTNGDEITCCPPSPEARCSERVASVLDLIGQTPVVDVSALSPKPNVTILAKLEGRNPAGSVKDRVALSLVDAASATGMIRAKPDQILIERLRATPGSRSPWSVDCAATTSRSYCRRRVTGTSPVVARLGSRDHRLAGRRGIERRRASRPIAQR